MILSLSGRMHSGKDLVAKIIQYLTTEASEAGKAVGMHCTIQEYLLKGDNSCNDVYQIKKFAYKLKQIATILTGVPIENWEDQDFKSQEMPPEWDQLKQVSENEPNGKSVGDGYLKVPMTYREFLQKLGTEAVRDGLHVNTWCNALMSEYKPVQKIGYATKTDGQGRWIIDQTSGAPENHWGSLIPGSKFSWSEDPNWIISDTRFPNEYEAVKERGGICARITRVDKTDTRKFNEVPNWDHPSETSLDGYKFDYYIDNSGSIEDLIEEVRKMLVHFKLLPNATSNSNT